MIYLTLSDKTIYNPSNLFELSGLDGLVFLMFVIFASYFATK